MKFQEFGWNGFLFEIPDDMRFVKQGGDSNTGSFSFEAESYTLEAKWQPLPAKKRIRPLTIAAENMVKQMKEISKRKDVKISRRENAHVSSHDAIYLVVKSDVEERVYVWYCEESRRIVVFRFVFKSFDEASKQIMKHILDTLVCHSENTYVWSLLNLRFATPVSFLLSEARIAVGRAYFMMTDRKLSTFAEKNSEIYVEYFSMANLVYKETYGDLDLWFEKNYRKNLRDHLKDKRIKYRNLKTAEVRGHKSNVKRGVRNSGFSTRKTVFCTNTTWYCPDMNRIYSVTVATKIIRPFVFKRKVDEEAHIKMLEELLTSLVCH